MLTFFRLKVLYIFNEIYSSTFNFKKCYCQEYYFIFEQRKVTSYLTYALLHVQSLTRGMPFSIHWATPTRARECRFPCLPSCPLPLLPGTTLCRKPLSVCLAWGSYLISVLQWRSVWVHVKSKILPYVTICLLSVSELDLEFFEGSVCIFLCCSQQLWNGGVNM